MISNSDSRSCNYRLLAILLLCFYLLPSASAEICSSCVVGCCDQYFACPVSRSSCSTTNGTVANNQNDVNATCSASVCSTGCCSTTTSCGSTTDCANLTCNATACKYECCVNNQCGSISDCGVTAKIVTIVVLTTVLVVMVLLFVVVAFIPFGRLKPKGAPAKPKGKAAVQMTATGHADMPVYQSEASYQQSRGYDDRIDPGYQPSRGGPNYTDYRVETYQPHDEY